LRYVLNRLTDARVLDKAVPDGSRLHLCGHCTHATFIRLLIILEGYDLVYLVLALRSLIEVAQKL
jgi:hypothetical protein